MISSVVANLNSLGNPQIFKNPSGNQVTIARSATGISIIITPSLPFDATNTQAANSLINSDLIDLGFGIVYNGTTIVIGTNELISLDPLTSYNFSIRDGSDTEIGTEELSIEILGPEFDYEQSSCEYCVTFENISDTVTSQNPPISGRGKLEYIINGDIVSGNYNQNISYCTCEAANDQTVTAILTIRQIPHCGGLSPIVFQSIYTGVIDIVEYKPSIQFEAPLGCCVPLNTGITITPVDIIPNNDTPHDIGCTEELTLKYILTNPDGDEVNILATATGTISTSESSTTVTGASTLFTSFPIGGKLYNSDNELLGVIDSITDDTTIILEKNATETYSGTFQTESFNYLNPDLDSVFEYTPTQLGAYKLTAILTNCCASTITEWDINICKSYLVETGTCNNPTIKNLSSINFLRINLTTYNGLSLIDETTNKEVYKNTLISPLSGLLIENLEDGFYKLVIEELDDEATVLSTETQYIFFDCNIKNCQIKLTQDILCFQSGRCVDNSEKEYINKNLELIRFFAYKEILYSYWSKIIKVQSIPQDWDNEEHLQEIATYTEIMTYINKMCQSCNSEKKHCYSFASYSKDYTVYVNKKECTSCNK